MAKLTFIELEWPPVGEVMEHRVRRHRTIGRRGHCVEFEMRRSIRGVAASQSESRTNSLRDMEILGEDHRPRLDSQNDRRSLILLLGGWPANEVGAKADTQCLRHLL